MAAAAAASVPSSVRHFVFIDNSNMFIEGQKTSGETQDMETDKSFRIDFGKLLQFVCTVYGKTVRAEEAEKAFFFGSRPPENDSLWKKVESCGIKIFIYDRSRITGKEKQVDTSLVTKVVECTKDIESTRSIIIIVTFFYLRRIKIINFYFPKG